MWRKKFHQPRWVRHAVLGPSKRSKRWNSQLSTHNAIWQTICSDKINVAEKIPPCRLYLLCFPCLSDSMLSWGLYPHLSLSTRSSDLLQQSHKVLWLWKKTKIVEQRGQQSSRGITTFSVNPEDQLNPLGFSDVPGFALKAFHFSRSSRFHALQLAT